jgi:hypothetical protein
MHISLELSGVALAIIALIALLAALKQLKIMRGDANTQISIAQQQERAIRASILLALDERWGSQTILEARTEMSHLIQQINKTADEQWGSLITTERRKRVLDSYPIELEKMRLAKPPTQYYKLLNACSFFETVGYVTFCTYVPLTDILRMFGPAIKDAGLIFEQHLRKLRQDSGDDNLYDNFLWLINSAQMSPESSTGARKNK